MRVLVVNGPNLNMLGKRERGLYGSVSLYELHRILVKTGEELGLEVITFQSNSEAQILEAIHGARGRVDWIVINPGALTHTSVALRDALLAAEIPFIEVHITNVYAREDFRKRSFLSDIAVGVISGLGIHSYILALNYIREVGLESRKGL